MVTRPPVCRPRAATGAPALSWGLIGLLGLIGSIGLIGLAAVPARAAQWYELYERGLEAEERGAWQEALDLFEEAERYRSEPEERVRTYGNRFLFDYDPAFHRARCLTELGRPEEARAALAASAAAGVTAEQELSALRERLARLESREARRTEAGAEDVPAAGLLDVHTDPPGVEIEIDGRPAGTTPVEGIEVAAGRHRVRLVDGRPGADLVPWEQTVEVLPAERVHLEVGLARRGDAAGEGGRASSTRTPVEAPRRPAAGGDEPRVAEAPDREEPAGPRQRRQRRQGQEGEGAGTEPEGAEADLPETGLSAPPAPPARPEDGVVSGAVSDAAPDPATTDDGTATEPGGPSGPSEPPAPAEAPARWTRSRVAALVAVALALALAAGLLAARSRRWGRRASRGGSGGTGGIDRRVGGRIGGYRVEEVLGRGGMATTYRARRLGDRREVALKIPHETGDPTYAERFVREGRLGETLHHPGIVRILEAGQDDGQAFLAMELLPGRTLRALMDSAEAPLPVERCLAIVREIAEALDYAHTKGVVHRDLKPENVMVLPDGALRVMDFGVARVEGQPGLTNSQFFFGSPVYAAPELVDPRSIDHRADLYSLGVLLFELLEGEPPFVHESIFKLLEMHQREPLPSPDGLPRPLPPEVWRLVARMLAKPREARYGSAQELLVELNRLLHASSNERPPAGASVPDGG